MVKYAKQNNPYCFTISSIEVKKFHVSYCKKHHMSLTFKRKPLHGTLVLEWFFFFTKCLKNTFHAEMLN